MNGNARKAFLTAEWRHLAMANYRIEPDALLPFLPAGLELDSWNGQTFVSVVGFLFLKTRICGIPIPFHRNFEEVNLRFYVRRKAEDGWRRGVVFIKEIVPRAAIAFIARAFYDEPYVALAMSSRIRSESRSLKSAEFTWRSGGRQNSLRLAVRGGPQELREGSEAEFITEHYWGYNRQRDGSTFEYRVEHPRWRTWSTESAQLDCDVEAIYGARFKDCLSRTPASAFLAEGSAVTVLRGIRLAA
jgi:uncharacterized protein YqjF (DUF2071 family)